MGLNPNQDLSQLPNSTSNQQQQQKQHPQLNCPRCDSTNTKFCYYNNYSKLQPRHYCRSCKRHWTAGGTLRNVPIGGATRKCKRQKTTHNDDNSDDNNNNEHKVSVPFNGDNMDTSIFPDTFKLVLFQPQIPPLMPAPEDFHTGCSSSNSSSSIYSFNGEKSTMNLLNGYGNGPIWGQDSSVQSGSYWNCWDGMMEFDAPNESQQL